MLTIYHLMSVTKCFRSRRPSGLCLLWTSTVYIRSNRHGIFFLCNSWSSYAAIAFRIKFSAKAVLQRTWRRVPVAVFQCTVTGKPVRRWKCWYRRQNCEWRHAAVCSVRHPSDTFII